MPTSKLRKLVEKARKGNNHQPPLALIEKKLGGRPVLLPILKGDKHPTGCIGWQNTTYEKSQSAAWQLQLRAADCIGVLLGAPSGHVVVIDVDEPAEVGPLIAAMPFLAGTFQIEGQPG